MNGPMYAMVQDRQVLRANVYDPSNSGLYELLDNSSHWATRALDGIIFSVTFQRYERIKSTILMGYRLT